MVSLFIINGILNLMKHITPNTCKMPSCNLGSGSQEHDVVVDKINQFYFWFTFKGKSSNLYIEIPSRIQFTESEIFSTHYLPFLIEFTNIKKTLLYLLHGCDHITESNYVPSKRNVANICT